VCEQTVIASEYTLEVAKKFNSKYALILDKKQYSDLQSSDAMNLTLIAKSPTNEVEPHKQQASSLLTCMYSSDETQSNILKPDNTLCEYNEYDSNETVDDAS